MQAREGELIRTKNGVIFDVKGLMHPPSRIIAFPRFIPSQQGTRRDSKRAYGKIYSFSDRFKFLEQNMPELIVHDPVFDETLCEVPHHMIERRYDPIEKLGLLRTSKKLNTLEQKVVQLAEELKEAAGIPWNAIGISGSVLVELASEKSDVDPVIYGAENCRRAYEALETLLKDDASGFKSYSHEDLKALFDFRSKDTMMSFEDFARVERRKAFQGIYGGTEYFIRFVKDWIDNVGQYGDVHYKNVGYAKISATIVDDAEALFTPCTYQVEDVAVVEGSKLEPIREVSSFRGRFCKQAKKGEKVTVQGKVERVIERQTGRVYYRIIIGNNPSDYMILAR